MPSIYHPPLSRREKQVAGLLTTSYRAKEIAEVLGLSLKAVCQYQYQIAQKYGVKGRNAVEACLKAKEKREFNSFWNNSDNNRSKA